MDNAKPEHDNKRVPIAQIVTEGGISSLTEEKVEEEHKFKLNFGTIRGFWKKEDENIRKEVLVEEPIPNEVSGPINNELIKPRPYALISIVVGLLLVLGVGLYYYFMIYRPAKVAEVPIVVDPQVDMPIDEPIEPVVQPEPVDPLNLDEDIIINKLRELSTDRDINDILRDVETFPITELRYQDQSEPTLEPEVTPEPSPELFP